MPLPTNKTIPLSTTNNQDKDTIILNQNDSVEELTEIMKEICATVGEQIYKFKLDFKKTEELLEKNYHKNENNNGYHMNNNFADIELLEENLDTLFHKFKKIKKEISSARLASHYIENRKKE